jgi:amidase
VDPSQYAQCDAVALAELISRGEVSPAEVADAARRAVEKVDRALNALAGPLFDDPAEPGHPGPLAGVPFLIKDFGITAAGKPCENGSRLTQGRIATSDSELMARFRGAGLNTLGRTTTPEFAFLATTESVLCGITRNPWDPTKSTGGSSGGSAAMVAARAVPAASGSDAGGSIRIPSGRCGTVGLLPTRWRVSSAPAVDPLFGMSREFVITRTMRDVAAFLDAVSGPVPGDRAKIAPPWRPYREEVAAPTRALRIAFSTSSWLEVPTAPDVEAAVGAAAHLLERQGHHVFPADIRVDVDRYLRAFAVTWSVALAGWARDAATGTGGSIGPDTVEPVQLMHIEWARHLTASDLMDALAFHDEITRTVGKLFAGFDLFLCPTNTDAGLDLGVADGSHRSTDPIEYACQYAFLDGFLSLFNMTGQPALSLPLRTTEGGLPIGVQLAAGFGDEAALIRVGSALEEAAPWRSRVPPIDAAR